jgi:hypothetical protein
MQAEAPTLLLGRQELRHTKGERSSILVLEELLQKGE